MSRIVWLLAALALTPPTGSAAAQTVTFGIARDGSGFLFETVAIPLWVDMSQAGGERLGSYTVRVTFNPVVLSYSGIRPGTFADPVVRSDSAYLGILRLAAVSAGGADGYVDLGRLVFYVYDDSLSALTVEVLEASAAGTLTNLLPVVTTSNGTFCLALGRWGDVDRDGQANSRDALAILSAVVGYSLGTGFDMTMGDVDGDGLVNTRDALILLSHTVGLDIPGQRVMIVVPGACALGSATQVEVTPDVVDLVVGQRTALRVTSRTADGVPVVLNGLDWVVDDPRVGVVDPSSFEFIARDTGVTTLRAALGPGIQATASVVVRSRRGVWHVNGQVARGAIALGTASYPFRTPQQAFPHIREGDTIRVAPGVVDYDGALSTDVYAGFVLKGDTLADGTRPVLRAPNGCCYAAYMYYLYGAPPTGSGVSAAAARAATATRRRVEFHDIVLQNFSTVLYARGLSSLVMRNVTVEAGPYVYNYGIDIDNPTDTVDLERVQFLADSGTNSGTALTLDGGGFLRMVDVTIRHFYTGVYLYEGVDSIHIAGSEIRGTNGDALGLYPDNRAIKGLYIANSRFINNFRGLAGFELQRATLVNNVWDNHRSQTLQFYAPFSAQDVTGPVLYTVTGDSVRSAAPFSDWIQASQFDTLRVTDVHVLIDTVNSYMYAYGGHAEFRRTVLDGASYEGFDLDVESAVLDTVSVLGCATCAFNNVTGVYVDAPSGRAGPTVTVRGGTFRRLYEGVNVSFVNTPGPLTVRGALMDSVQFGIRGNVDSAVIENNVITNVHNTGIRPVPSGDRPASQMYAFRGNQVACRDTVGTQYGIYAERTPMVFEGNYVQNCEYGLYVYNSLATLLEVSFARDSVFAAGVTTAQRGIYVQNRWRPTLYGVRVRGAVYGIDISTNDTGTVRVDSSAVSQTTTGALRLAPSAVTTATGVRNNLTNNALDGIVNSGSGTRSFTLGRFVGNARYAVNSSASFDATNNWWGATTGPGGGAGDSVTTLTSVITSPYLDADTVSTPSPAPPAFTATVAAALTSASPVPPVVAKAPPAVHPEPVAGQAARDAARERKRQRQEQERLRSGRH